jgi:hypothetical protein
MNRALAHLAKDDFARAEPDLHQLEQDGYDSRIALPTPSQICLIFYLWLKRQTIPVNSLLTGKTTAPRVRP